MRRRWIALGVGCGILLTVAALNERARKAKRATILADSEFDVSISGLSIVSTANAAAAAEAYPDTDVRIQVEAREALATPFELGVYRAAGDELRRVEIDIEHEAFQGAASESGPARAFTGTDRPGEYRLFLLIAPAGELPTSMTSTHGADPRVALASGGGRVFSRKLRILATNEGDNDRTASPMKTADLSWEIYDAPCPDSVSLYSRSCGTYGELHFGVTSSSCKPFDSGSVHPFGYPGHAVKDSSEWKDLALVPSAGPWTALIDWGGSRGLAAAAVLESLSGPDIPAVSYYLDDFALSPLGTLIGDQHLLAKLCEISNDLDTGTADLKSLALSLGRVSQSTDPVAGKSCSGTLACHIRGLLGHLRDRGVAIAAAAGDHQELLFPAFLDETLAVASLDLGGYLENGGLRSTWESPAQYDAILPGHGLCVDGETLPSGSSLSTAFLAGGLARLLDAMPGIDPYSGGSWVTQWSSANDCMVLAQRGVEHPYCNPELENILGGIMQGTSGGCWDSPDPHLIAVAGPPGIPLPQPPTLGLVQWVARNLKSAPKESLCIPCTDDDSYPPLAGDLFLNLTRSEPLSSSVYLDSLFLRTGESFYEIELSEEDLERFALAQLDGIVLPGFGAVLEHGVDHAIFYILTANSDQGCLDDAAGDADSYASVCYWHSTQILP